MLPVAKNTMRRDSQEIKALQIQICKASDEVAFAALFRLFYGALYKFAIHYVHQHEIAEELVNDVFVKLWKQRLTLEEIENLESYLFVAVKNSALNYLKQYSHYHIDVDEKNTFGLISVHDPQKDLEWKELYFKMQQAVNQLPEQSKAVFRLVREEGFRMKQVADILGISSRTVETQLYRAVKKLDAVLSQYYDKKGNANSLMPVLIFLLMMASGFS